MNIGLCLFFTRGVSLRTWATIGMLGREVALYRRLTQRGFSVDFVTYGGSSELEYANNMPGIRILCNERDLPWQEYEKNLVELHGEALKECRVIKTNQTYGADLALRAATALGKRFVARCGYMWSYNAAREQGEASAEAMEALRVESLVFGSADRVVVTTEAMREDVIRRVPQAASRVSIVPNYVDTDLFRPMDVEKDGKGLVFIGRIAPEKNLGALLTAVRDLDVRLTIIGEGKLRSKLQEEFGSLKGRIEWVGNVPNSRLPEYLNGASLFVLPSRYEGHPKSLLEAMSCGVPVLGADSPGIRQVIRHGETGFLCASDASSIRGAILHVLSHKEQASTLGRNARRYVEDKFSLDKIAEVEAELLQEVVSGQ